MRSSGWSRASGRCDASPNGIPPGEVPITADLVIGLVADQFPHFADLPLTHLNDGWDNSVYRLGDELLVRLPRRQLAADIAVAEHDWLPRLADNWTFPAPVPLAVGQPGRGYPWRWALVPWLTGTVAMEAPLTADGAADLGAALAQVHVPAPDGCSVQRLALDPAGAQGGAVRSAARTCSQLGQSGCSTRPTRWPCSRRQTSAETLTWCHLDVHGNNILTRDGRLAGMLDWGDSGAGDPATDLGQALYMVGSAKYTELAAAYVAGGGPAAPFAPRVRAEALAYAVTMATLDEPHYRASGWSALQDLGVAARA